MLLTTHLEKAKLKEENNFHPKAAYSKDYQRLERLNKEDRLAYKRDVDRIIHSKPYSRYVDKTQVVYLADNDHITHRSLHVQLVSHFARSIAEDLNLNVDLVEAISLGHDVGHPPFGHEGEEYLSKISVEYGNGIFAHPWQSCRLFSEIDPLNLCLNVYDGFLCHDGGLSGTKLIPNFGKTWEDHFRECQEKLTNPEKNIMPGTLEGCLVKISDTISYVGRDIEDAISIGLIERKDIPHTILGNNNRDILQALQFDLTIHSEGKDYIAISDEALNSLKILREFNFANIYLHPKLKSQSKKISQSYKILFDFLYEDLIKNEQLSYIWLNFCYNKPKKYLTKASPVQMVIDFVAGMTDTFFIRTLESFILPQRIRLNS